MRFALIDNKQVEAKQGLTAICSGCLQPVIAKCGIQRVHHWAHCGNRMCDSWWEPETQWHRAWKNNFPNKWQEIFLPDEQTGEKHIADVRTNYKLVIEFQHSHITPQERNSREKFYKNMIWVVDGTRLKRDYPRFIKGKNNFRVVRKGVYRIDFPGEYFPVAWLNSTVPVIFDFNGFKEPVALENNQNVLNCLFPVRIGGSAILAEIPVSAFIKTLISSEWLIRTRNFMQAISQVNQERNDLIKRQQPQFANVLFQKFIGAKTYRKSRRF